MLAPNITSQKVAIPSILFLALSPGMLLKTNGMKLSFKTGTDTSSVFFHGDFTSFGIDHVESVIYH